MERRTKGLWELPDEFLRTGLEGLCSNIPNWNSGRNYEPDFVCVKGTPERIHEPGFGWKGKEKTKMKGEGEDEREG
ncbi:unnamed protein product [Rhizophagus irregularis]|nr:unnamed protein product [Rhizophagus irregularis]